WVTPPFELRRAPGFCASIRHGKCITEYGPRNTVLSHFSHFPFSYFDYLLLVQTFAQPFASLSLLNQVTVPDLWQQEAVSALRAGKDVVVQAPTGAGKTLIFELWSNQGKNRGQAIYTVPTRALANDKL